MTLLEAFLIGGGVGIVALVVFAAVRPLWEGTSDPDF